MIHINSQPLGPVILVTNYRSSHKFYQYGVLLSVTLMIVIHSFNIDSLDDISISIYLYEVLWLKPKMGYNLSSQETYSAVREKCK